MALVNIKIFLLFPKSIANIQPGDDGPHALKLAE